MKKIKIALCVILAAVVSLHLTACGEKEDEVEKDSGTESVTETDKPKETEKEEEAATVEIESGITSIRVEHHDRTVCGDAFIPEADSFPLVIFSHGYNGYKDDFKDTAEYMMDSGIAAITFTFCGSGDRDPSGFGTTNMTLFTEKEDLSALVDYAKQIKGFNGSLYLLGGSQGGMVSAMVAEEREEDIKGMVLLFPAFSIPDNWNNTNYPADRYPTPESIPETIDFWGVKLGRDFVVTLRDLDIYENMADFQKPVLILHGTEDAIVPISYSKRAAENYPNAEMVTYNGEGHGFSSSKMRDMEERLLDFIADNP